MKIRKLGKRQKTSGKGSIFQPLVLMSQFFTIVVLNRRSRGIFFFNSERIVKFPTELTIRK